jgi:hypothetical protein
MTTPTMQTPILMSSDLVITSPKNKKAIRAAQIGDVLLRNATFDKDINLTARLNTKNVIVPEIPLMIITFH